MDIRFAHTNVVARDWRALAEFYERALACVRVPVERDYPGETISKVVGVETSRLTGIHLRLPGYGENGPTLEILQYDPAVARPPTAANLPGFSHIAFAVDDVRAVAARFIELGGRAVGEYTILDVAGAGRVELQYLADPEGNIVELQCWRSGD